jgi:hypothetical protein
MWFHRGASLDVRASLKHRPCDATEHFVCWFVNGPGLGVEGAKAPLHLSATFSRIMSDQVILPVGSVDHGANVRTDLIPVRKDECTSESGVASASNWSNNIANVECMRRWAM